MKCILETENKQFLEFSTWQKLQFFLKILNKHLKGNMNTANIGILNVRL